MFLYARDKKSPKFLERERAKLIHFMHMISFAKIVSLIFMLFLFEVMLCCDIG